MEQKRGKGKQRFLKGGCTLGQEVGALKRGTGTLLWTMVKGQKIVQNDKRFCLSCSISQEPYIIWLSFVIHRWKMIISPGFFSFFSKFWYFGLLVGSDGKKWPKMTKNSFVPYIGAIYHMILIYGTHVKG